jgi:hypothetical protein
MDVTLAKVSHRRSFCRNRAGSICGMRKLYCVAAILAVLVSVPGARAQQGDWGAVKKLAPGTRISVKTSVRLVCYFESATDEDLYCDMRRHVRFATMDSGRHYERKRIREVRLEHSEESDAAVGALVGAGAGAAIGAGVPGNGTVTRGGRVLLLGGIGAIVGGFAGREFAVAHGRVVYKR